MNATDAATAVVADPETTLLSMFWSAHIVVKIVMLGLLAASFWSWTIIVNKTADQWGAFSYDQSKDIGRFDLPVQKPSSPVEEFTISLDKQPGNTVNLTFAWGDQMVSTTLKPA